MREFLGVDELESLDIPVFELEDSVPFVMYLSCSVRVSLKKKNPRLEAFLCSSSSSSHFQRSISRISWKMWSESPWLHSPLPEKITSKSREPLVQISVFLRPIYTNFCQPFFNRISDACFYISTVSCSNLSVLRECTLRISLTAQALRWIQTSFSYTADFKVRAH